MLALLLAQLAAVAPPPAVVHALEQSLPPHARVEVAAYRAPLNGCAPEAAEVKGAIRSSGQISLRVVGVNCAGWATAELKLFETVAVSTREVHAGESLADAAKLEEREVPPGRQWMFEIPSGAAAHSLAAGRALEPSDVRGEAVAAGAEVDVLIRCGGVELIQSGHGVPCSNGRSCAVLTNGRRVEGNLHGRVLLVEVP